MKIRSMSYITEEMPVKTTVKHYYTYSKWPKSRARTTPDAGDWCGCKSALSLKDSLAGSCKTKHTFIM